MEVYSPSQRENLKHLKCFRLPVLVLMKSLSLFVPWWLEKRGDPTWRPRVPFYRLSNCTLQPGLLVGKIKPYFRNLYLVDKYNY